MVNVTMPAQTPKEKEKLMREMMDSAVHFGHQSDKWNPKMKRFIWSKRQKIHIIDLAYTAEMLPKACLFLTKSASEGKKILFVSTKPQSAQLIAESAKKCNMPYVTGKWMSGLLTNFSTIKKRTKYLLELKKQNEEGELEKYTKKEAGTLRKVIEKLEISLGGVANLVDLPDVLFVVDVVRDKIAIKEAKKLRIPIVAIVDTNGDPSNINYVIPGNDDSIKSLKYLVEKVTNAILAGKK